MRAVVDTNVIVSAFLSPKGAPAGVLERWRRGAFELLVSDGILEQYLRALSYAEVRERLGLDTQDIAQAVEDLRQFATLLEPSERLLVITKDQADNKFLECAVAGGVEYIVSGDSHLLALKEYQGIQVLAPSEFLAVLNSQ